MAFNILSLVASGRAASVSSSLARELVAHLQSVHADATVVSHDLAQDPLPVVNDDWVGGAFAPPAARTPQQAEELKLSDRLVDELLAADAIVIGTPLYNFSIPAALKAWIDQIVRAGRTFTYHGPGQFSPLVPAGKKVYVVVTSGGVPVGSPYDAATGYLKLVFGFVGLTDVTVIAADQLQTVGEGQIAKAKAEIAALAG
jgi:FMN-dependent NADH-azoreductase